MQVFKLYFKLLKKNMSTLMVYIGIFLVITIIYTLNMQETSNTIFEVSKERIAYINKDVDSPLLQGFKAHLGKNSQFIEIEETQEGMQDALFFRDVTYILIIPEGFTEDFLMGKEPVFEKRRVPDSVSGANVDIVVNNYFNTAGIYLNHLEDLTEAELIEKVAQDLDIQVEVDLYTNGIVKEDKSGVVFYYNYLVYAILSVLILGIGSIMISFTNLDIKRRNLSSPVSLYSFQFQQVLGNLTIALIVDLLFIIIGIILTGQSPFHKTSILFMLNVMVFTVAALSIAYLVGSLTKSREVTNGIANVVGLGLSFVSGVFVPKELLGETTIQISKFTPAYWYTTANDIIGDLTNFSWAQLSPVFGNMLIQLGFAITIFTISLVINKKKSREAA